LLDILDDFFNGLRPMKEVSNDERKQKRNNERNGGTYRVHRLSVSMMWTRY